jgi:hemin uptake protein HemP
VLILPIMMQQQETLIDDKASAGPGNSIRQIQSYQLMQGKDQLAILHRGETYRLRMIPAKAN